MFIQISKRAVINTDDILKIIRNQLTNNHLTGETYGDWIVILKNGDQHLVEGVEIDELKDRLNQK